MGNSVTDKGRQLEYLQNRLEMFMTVIDAIDPESTEIEDIDRLIKMVNEIEEKYKRFKKDWE